MVTGTVEDLNLLMSAIVSTATILYFPPLIVYGLKIAFNLTVTGSLVILILRLGLIF